MSLADFTPATRDVSLGKDRGSVTIRGLNLNDLTLLVTMYKEGIEQSVRIFYETAEDKVALEDIAMTVLQTVPVLGSQIIAMGAGDATLVDKAVMLPFPLQIELLTVVCELTFEDAGGPKNFMASLLRIAARVGLKIPTDAQSRLATITRSPTPPSPIGGNAAVN